MNINEVQEHISSLAHAENITLIQRGFSFDQKYFIYHTSKEPTHVLRTASIQQMDRKKREFDVISRVHHLGLKTSIPIEFGVIESMDLCYMVLSFVAGEDASDVLPTLTTDEQYQIGLEAGRELKLIHEIEAPYELEDWYTRRSAKHIRQLTDYQNCGYRLPEEDLILEFIHHHLEEMCGRPSRLQHDDFHPSNLIVHERRYSGAIDFNRFDWGDPYHEFLKIAYFSRNDSVPFSIGQVDGYFNGNIPEQFQPGTSLSNCPKGAAYVKDLCFRFRWDFIEK